MAKIDELIRKQQEEVNKAKDDDKPAAQAKLEGLQAAKAAGIEMDNEEVNGFVTRKTKAEEERWTGLLGVKAFEDAAKVFTDLEDENVRSILLGEGSGSDDGEGGGGEEKPVAERIQEALKSRDTRIENLSTTLGDVNRRYSADKVETAVEKAFREAGLVDTFLAPAKRLAGYDDLVEKVAGGNSVTTDEINAKIEGVKTLSGVWFKSEGEEENGNGGGTTTVAGHKIVEEAVRPHIPATPTGQQTTEITDEDRAARSSSAY